MSRSKEANSAAKELDRQLKSRLNCSSGGETIVLDHSYFTN